MRRGCTIRYTLDGAEEHGLAARHLIKQHLSLGE
jgi:hypothetical protein